MNESFPYTLDTDKIPTKKVFSVPDGSVHYACPDSCWLEHLAAWSKLWRENPKSPQPFPKGHCMFSSPQHYACVPYGCTDAKMIRDAWEIHVRGLLNGWDRDVQKDKLDKIVNATVEAYMAGADIGATPFMACIYVGL